MNTFKVAPVGSMPLVTARKKLSESKALSSGITLDCYSHCLPALSEEAACRVAALVLAD